MLSRWVPLLRPGGRPRKTGFKHRLIRNVVISLLLISLLPALILGTLNSIRTRSLLNKQVSAQMETIVKHQADQLTQFVDLRNRIIERMATDQRFGDSLFALAGAQPGSEEQRLAKSSIQYSFNSGLQVIPGYFFDQMFIVRPDGTLLMATDEKWFHTNIGTEKIQPQALRDLLGTNRSTFLYSPAPVYTSRMVLVISRSFVDEKGAPFATLFTISSTNLAELAVSAQVLSGSASYYFTRNEKLLGISNNQVVRAPENNGLSATAAFFTQQPASQSHFSTRFNNTPVIAYAQWLPGFNIGLALTVNEQSVFQLNTYAAPVNVLVLIVALLVTGGLLYLGSSSLFRPLGQLARSADLFAHGNWSERVHIRREDEIGHLAYTFNRMADDLSELNHSLEMVVERRTGQLRIASEVAQMATSTTRLSDALGRTVELIAERFGFYHVAIYLFDETGKNLVLREASGSSGLLIKKRGDQIEANADSLIGWVAGNNRAKIIYDTKEDILYRPDELLPDTRSETAIPITIGKEVLGVLDIRSTLVDAFDDETLAVFQTLANQISNTLQATRLLEATQVSYKETALLYQATRQVSQARQEAEMMQHLTDALVQLPFTGTILSVEEDRFKILAITDPKTGKAETNLQSITIPVGKMAELLAANRVVLIEDISQPSDYDNLLSFLVRRDCKSAALIAILENGRLSKLLILGTQETGLISQSNLQPYADLADIISAMLDKHRVLNTLQQRLAELQILANFSKAISAETDLTHLYRVLHEQVIQTLGPDLVFAIAIYNQRENQIEWPYFYEDRQVSTYPPDKLGTGLTSILIESRQPLLLTNEKEIKTLGPIIEGKPPRSWMGIPLIFAGDIVGAILIQDLENEYTFNQDDVNLFMTLAPQIATSVRNTQLYTETQQALHAYDHERFLFNTLLDNIPEGISIKDTHGRYVRTSESIAQIFNMRAEEIVGKTDFDLMDREVAEKVFHDEQAVMNIGKPEIGLIQQIVTPDGKEAWTHTSRVPIRTYSGDPYGMLLIQRDITDLKQAEGLAQRRADQVLTAAEIARDATGTLDVKTLLQKSVNLVRDRFGFYHSSIFLLDSTGDYAVLRESTGLAGEKMLQKGHRLAVGSRSIVGRVTATGNPLIVNDVTVDETHLPNPLLPDTRSELAMPLKVGERILGALDVQSTQLNAFNAEDVGVLQILADQMAVAVTNGELFAKTQDLLAKHRLLRQITVAASSSTDLEDAMVSVVGSLLTAPVCDRIAILLLNEERTLQTQASAGYEGTRHLEMRIAMGQGVCGKAAQEKRPIQVDDVLSDSRYINIDPDVRSELAIPILFGKEILGVLNLESTHGFAFDENDLEILGALGNNLGGVIANIRLVNQVRQQVIRERQLFEVTSKIRYSVDMETILETSAKEIARALGARRASIRVTAGSPPQPEGTGGDKTAGGDRSAGGGRENGRSNGRSNGDGKGGQKR